jgi:hypothetical protein
MSPPRSEFFRRAVGCFAPAALLALAPKCLLCLAGYAGLGVALGLARPELCGGPTSAAVPWASAVAWLGTAAGVGACGFLAACRRVRNRGTGRVARAGVN